MNGYEDYLLFTAIAVLAAAAGWWVRGAWHQVTDPGEAPLPLFEALRRTGARPADVGGELAIRQLAEATRRCALCAGKAECRAKMANDPGDAFLEQCPNAELLRRLWRAQG